MNATGFALVALVTVVAVAVAFWYFGRSSKESFGGYPVATKPEVEVEDQPPQDGLDRTLQLLGLPAVRAGHQLMNVPCVDPMKSGSYTANHEVVTVSRATVYTDVGVEEVGIIELEGGGIIMAIGGKSLVMDSREPSMADEKLMDDTRIREYETTEFGTLEYEGQTWNVVGVYGINEDRKSGERENSYIEVLSTNPGLGKSGLQSMLSPATLDGRSHNYYDLRANCPATNQLLFTYFVEGTWNIYVGRFLTRVEVGQLQGV